MYQVAVAAAPAFELITSLTVYLQHKQYRFLELPADWVRETRSRLGPAFAAQLDGLQTPPDWAEIALLIWQCPDPADFLTWYASLSAGDLYERLSPWLDNLPRDLLAQRDQHVAILRAWQAQYFSHVDPAMLDGLAAEAIRLQASLPALPPPDLVELATGGMWAEPEPELQQVLLVPQYHFRPWTIPCHLRGMRIYGYPVDVWPSAAGQPSAGLLRLTRALADENRLRMLHFLAGEKRSFGEVVRFSGLTKGTVYHHLVALRAAGLVRIHDAPGYNKCYSLRPGALQRVGARLHEFASEPI